MKLLAGVALVAILCAEPIRAPPAFSQPNPLRDKNFYLLSLFENFFAAAEALRHDPFLAPIAEQKQAAAAQCKLDVSCIARAFRWSDSEVAAVGQALRNLYQTSNPVRELTDSSLRTSGMYIRSDALSGADLLVRAWSECAAGINHTIDVYALGLPPRYPEIDSMLYDAKSPGYGTLMRNLSSMIEDQKSAADLFFTVSEHFALETLILNGRDEASRYEPLEKGENSLSYAVAQITVWSKYRYSAIVVPGSGGDRPGVRLSASGKLRDEIAAKRWKQGDAPFLIVSGGHVHPNRTEYAEAIEMKHDLMTRLGVPEQAIIVEPHARHTTTNMRNAARLMYRYGFPFDKQALVTTDPDQSAYIEGEAFAKRCIDELGYMPYRIVNRISTFDVVFRPQMDSLQSDPNAPLDP